MLSLLFSLRLLLLLLIFLLARSGVRDGRFQPVDVGEIPSLECKVSLLKCYEPAENYMDWEIGVHGLTIEFDDDSRCEQLSPRVALFVFSFSSDNARLRRWKRSATYLPDIAKQEGWSKLETIDSLIRK